MGLFHFFTLVLKDKKDTLHPAKESVDSVEKRMERARIFQVIQGLIADLLNVSEGEVAESSYFSDLGAESIDIVNLVMHIEEEFGVTEIEDEDLLEMLTVGQVVDYLDVMLRDKK